MAGIAFLLKSPLRQEKRGGGGRVPERSGDALLYTVA